MKRSYIFQCYALLISLSCVIPLMSHANDALLEHNQVEESPAYVCLDDSVSMIRHVIAEMSQFDTNLDSPLHLLRRHIDNGNIFGLRNEIRDVLEYAYWFAGQNTELLQQKELCSQFEDVVQQFFKGELDITEEEIIRSFGDDMMVTKGCDINASCNINMNESIDATVGNIVKPSGIFMHNFGTNNSFLGANAGNFSTSGTNNTGIGCNALNANTAGGRNTAVGSGALSLATSDTNTAIGFNALQNISGGGGSVAVGSLALHSNTTGYQNTAIGTTALGATTIGANNTAIGYHALLTNTSGVGNIAVGAGAAVSVTTGSNNICVGTAIAGSTTTGSNNIYIAGSGLSPANESNTIRIGSGTTAAYVSGIYAKAVGAINSPVVIDNTGKLGTTVSSIAHKRNIENMGVESDRIYDLNPVKFVYKKDATNTPQYGLIAEEVAKVFPELVINDDQGKPFTVRYELLSVLLVNELKKLSRKHEMEKAVHAHEFQQMSARVAALEKALASRKK